MPVDFQNLLFLFSFISIKMKKYILSALLILSVTSLYSQEGRTNLLVGTYTKPCESKGVYIFSFDMETAETKLTGSTQSALNPSFLSFSPDKKFVYCVNENGDNSRVRVYLYNSEMAELKSVASQNSMGNDPCHIISDADNIITANYSGGNIVVFEVAGGSLAEPKQILEFTGKSINETRQEKPHLHMVQFSPDKKYVLANDLGTDNIYVYYYFPKEPKEVLKLKNTVKVKPGSGPRHLTFSQDGKFVYLLQELDGTLTVFKFNDGELELLQETTVVDKNFKGETSAADIHISPDSKFLYATNRGEANTISCFEIKEDGKLKLVETVSTLGKGPRNFTIEPNGNFLLVANQFSNEIVVFKIDKTTGKLTDTKKRIKVCSPVCLVFDK